MFTIDPNITAPELMEKKLLRVIFSMNNHQVATPEGMLEDARSYVFFFREGGERISAYIGLHFIRTDRKLFYTYSANPFLEDDLRVIKDDARNFVEDLGAMVDELDFSNLSDQEQGNWFKEQGIFAQRSAPDSEPASQPDAIASQEAAQTPSVQQIMPADPAPSASQAPEASPQIQQATAPHVPQPMPATPPPIVQVVPEQPAQAPQETAVPVTASAVPVKPPALPRTPVQKPQKVPVSPLAAAAKKRQEIVQQATKAGIVKPLKDAGILEGTFPKSVVSRDREALARLLTSF